MQLTAAPSPALPVSSRVSTVVVDKPYMGLLANETTSYLEPAYAKTGVNSCWELYIHQANQYPGSGSNMTMQTFRDAGTSFDWEKQWVEGGSPNCPGKPSCRMSEVDDDTHQAVEWDVFYPAK